MMEIFARTAPTFDFLSRIDPGTSGDFNTMRLERDIRSPLNGALRSVKGVAFAKLERRVLQKTVELREANQSL